MYSEGLRARQNTLVDWCPQMGRVRLAKIECSFAGVARVFLTLGMSNLSELNYINHVPGYLLEFVVGVFS